MTVTQEKGELVIRVPMFASPVTSKSGKSKLIASTNGNRPTSLIIGGQSVIVSVNAYVPNTNGHTPDAAKK